MKKVARKCRRLKTYLGRVRRDLERNLFERLELLALIKPLFSIVDKVLVQEKHDKNKIYSFHEPDVECISKGKAHKKYEFGCKIVIHKEGLALSIVHFMGILMMVIPLRMF